MLRDKDKDGNTKKRPTGAVETVIRGRHDAPLHIVIDGPIHVHTDGAEHRIIEKLDALEKLLLNIQREERKDYKMTREEAQKLDTATNAIKTRIEALIAKHADDITPEEQAEVDADFAMLESLGRDASNPIPDPPTPLQGRRK